MGEVDFVVIFGEKVKCRYIRRWKICKWTRPGFGKRPKSLLNPFLNPFFSEPWIRRSKRKTEPKRTGYPPGHKRTIPHIRPDTQRRPIPRFRPGRVFTRRWAMTTWDFPCAKQTFPQILVQWWCPKRRVSRSRTIASRITKRR